MVTIKRKMEATISKGISWRNSQASINSDGVLTIRNYDSADKNNDEIIIFSNEETQAIIRLFSKLQIGQTTLPLLPF